MSENVRGAAIVTGAGSGIGRATVLRLVADGWPVVAADMNDTALARLRSELVHDEPMITVHVDVTSEADVEAAVQLACDRFGACRAMVNNAGVGGAFGSLLDISAEDWDYTFDVLARGVFFGIKHAAGAMRGNSDGGSIVNLGSVAAFSGYGGPAAYSAAKASVVALTQAAAVEFADDRIRVNAVCPGVVRTPLLGAPEDAQPPAAQPWRTWGSPDDIADVIRFLISEESRFITGQSILVDGGLSAAGPGREFARAMGHDVRHRGLAGVNRGNTGLGHDVRRRG